MSLTDLFRSPPAAYRGKPFWAWNGPLDEHELRRQIRVFKEMGLGGAFMHSRVGLATPYLSEQWFDLIRACADEAEKQGLEAWLYDEDRWPSGAAGGLVTRDERYRQRYVEMAVCEPEAYQSSCQELAAFVGTVEGDRVTSLRPLEGPTKPGEKVIAFRPKLTDTSPWYNNQTYLDTMSDEAVAKFVEVTHEAYGKNVLDRYGKERVPGIFTDEPHHGTVGSRTGEGRYYLPWTDKLIDVFRQRYGYDITAHLPELLLRVDGRDYSQVRRDYHDCITYLFTHAFAEQVGKWCDENDQLFTGHVLAEETLHSQTSVVGAAMRSYEFMQAPGIDILCGESLSRPGGRPMELTTAKQCSSAHHQFGRKWMLSELYGCTGWHFTLAEHKAVGDWQAALGVNLRCQHLSWYTMLGEAKRDYPASISFQSPWWKDYPVVEDYFARVGVLMTQGEPVRDVAVIHPIESAWGLYTLENQPAFQELSERFEKAQSLLLEEHFDFDYVDEEILARHGSVAGGELKVAKAAYRAVVVPPTVTLRESTVKTLEAFRQAGGQVVFVDPVAERVEGEPSDAAARLAAGCERVPLEREALAGALRANGKIRRASIRTQDGRELAPSLYMLRHDADSGRWLLFVCHTRQTEATGPLTITMPGKGQTQEWDAATGARYLADSTAAGDSVASESVEIRTDLPPYGSRLFVVDPQPDASLKPRPRWTEVSRAEVNPAEWPILRDEPNAFPLDTPEFAIDGGAWQGPMEILRVDGAVRDAAGLPRRGGGMCQPWAQTTPPSAKTVEVALRYRFDVETLPDGPCHLVMELPETFRIALNGQPLVYDESEGWWIDNSFRRIRIAPWQLVQGENVLEMETTYGATSGLECLYFTGELGMRWSDRRPVVTALPRALKLGDWTEQGLACYTGAVTYVANISPKAGAGERVFLEVPAWDGALLKVRVNGKPIGAIAWPPYEADITDALTDGPNRLEIQVTSTRKNLLGPLHCANPYPNWTGPGEFVTTGDRWTDDYVRIPYGLMAPPAVSVRR